MDVFAMGLVALIATVVALFTHDPSVDRPAPSRHYLGGFVDGNSPAGQWLARRQGQRVEGQQAAHEEQNIAETSARLARNSLVLLEQFIGKLESAKSSIADSNLLFGSAILREAQRMASLIERDIDEYGRLVSVAEQRAGTFSHNAYLATSINRNHRQLIREFKEVEGGPMSTFIGSKIMPELGRVETGHANANAVLGDIDTAITHARNTEIVFRTLQTNISGAEQRAATVETHPRSPPLNPALSGVGRL